MLRIFTPFTYWYDLYLDLRTFYIFRKVALKYEEMLERDHKLRVDWLGRIYGVINIPEEVEGAAPQIQEAYALQAITEYGKVMIRIGLADAVYPEIEKIPNAAAYLVVLWPEYTALSVWRIIGNLIRTGLIGIAIYLLTKIAIRYADPVMTTLQGWLWLLKSAI